MFPKSFFRYKDKDINWSVISINFNDQEEPPWESGTFSVIQATTIPQCMIEKFQGDRLQAHALTCIEKWDLWVGEAADTDSTTQKHDIESVPLGYS